MVAAYVRARQTMGMAANSKEFIMTKTLQNVTLIQVIGSFIGKSPDPNKHYHVVGLTPS